jgi:hypothetical protein
MGTMTEYRLYVFDSHGRMNREATFDCEDDAAALKVADQHRGPERMELWRGGRLVKSFPARH